MYSFYLAMLAEQSQNVQALPSLITLLPLAAIIFISVGIISVALVYGLRSALRDGVEKGIKGWATPENIKSLAESLQLKLLSESLQNGVKSTVADLITPAKELILSTNRTIDAIRDGSIPVAWITAHGIHTRAPGYRYRRNYFTTDKEVIEKLIDAELLRNRQDYQGARSRLKALLANTPPCIDVFLESAALHVSEGAFQDARADLKKAEAYAQVIEERAEVQFRVATCAMKEYDCGKRRDPKLLEEALESVQSASKLRDNDPRFLHFSGYAHWHKKLTKQAIELTQKALEILHEERSTDPLRLRVKNNLAYFLAEEGGDANLQAALNLSEDLVQLDPTQAKWSDTRAFVLFKAVDANILDRKKLQEAHELAKKALSQDPSHLIRQNFDRIEKLLDGQSSGS